MEGSAFSIECSACGKPAASISFAGQRQFGLGIARHGFLGDVFASVLGRQDATPELFAEIRNLAENNDLGSLRKIDWDFFGFICRHCDAAYCGSCWTNVYPTFDDGFYDETRGTCPRGHEQALDD